MASASNAASPVLRIISPPSLNWCERDNEPAPGRRQATPSTSPAGDHPVDEQDQHRADDRGEEPRPLARLIPVELLAEESGKHGAANAQQYGNQAAAGVAARDDRP